MDFGLEKEVIRALRDIILSNPGVEEVILYGSRAKGNFRKFSDIDLTLKGESLRHPDLFEMMDKIEDLYLPYMVDLSVYSDIDNCRLI